jgi:hypothetical protein
MVTIPVHGVRNRIEKNGPAIRAALDPDDRDTFAVELRIALTGADDSLDITLVPTVIDQWGRALLPAVDHNHRAACHLVG